MIVGSRSDEELIQDLAPGAVEELLDRYWAPAYRLARRFGLDEDAAQDAAQESFVRLLEHSQRFDPSRSFRAWFFQIVRNQARQRLRGERRRRVREQASARATELLAELSAGAEFAELAKAKSEDSSAPRGGDVGNRGRGLLAPPYESALFALAPGGRSAVVESAFGFHIIERLPDAPAP